MGDQFHNLRGDKDDEIIKEYAARGEVLTIEDLVARRKALVDMIREKTANPKVVFLDDDTVYENTLLVSRIKVNMLTFISSQIKYVHSMDEWNIYVPTSDGVAVINVNKLDPLEYIDDNAELTKKGKEKLKYMVKKLFKEV